MRRPHRRIPEPPTSKVAATGPMFLVMLEALRLVRPIPATALEHVLEGPAWSDADLRHIEVACGVFKEEANALVAMLIARESDDSMIREAEELFRYFSGIEAQIAAMLDTGQGRPAA